jgi:hypothetical protein
MIRTTETQYQNLRGDPLAGLLNAIVESLHAMAQPLTVVQATLEVASVNASSSAAYQKAIDDSLVQLARLVEQMEFAQELLRIAQDKPVLETIDVRTVLGIVEEDLRCVLQDAGMGLEVSVEEDVPLILASAPALRQSIFYLVLAALRHSSPGQRIRISVFLQAEAIRIGVRPEASSPGDSRALVAGSDPGAYEDRSMVLAEALLVAQGGSLEYRSLPFEADVTIPIASSSRIGTEAAAGACNSLLTVIRRGDGDSLEAVRV